MNSNFAIVILLIGNSGLVMYMFSTTKVYDKISNLRDVIHICCYNFSDLSSNKLTAIPRSAFIATRSLKIL